MQLIFSYGSLREERVQLSTFGRRLEGWADAVVGYERSSVINDDPETVAFSGTREHANLVPAESGARVDGMVFEITDAELVYVDDAVAAFFLHVQGSGRVKLAEGRFHGAHVRRALRVGMAGPPHDGHYRGEHREPLTSVHKGPLN